MNPGRWGSRLADYLEEHLPRFGVRPVGRLMEDWGYRVPLEAEHFPISICCGNYLEYDDGFLCFFDPSTPTIRRWFRTIDTRADDLDGRGGFGNGGVDQATLPIPGNRVLLPSPIERASVREVLGTARFWCCAGRGCGRSNSLFVQPVECAWNEGASDPE
jgi:hypothetical protein